MKTTVRGEHRFFFFFNYYSHIIYIRFSSVLRQEAMLAGADDKLVDVSFEYGRNIGLAFQLVDDLLDFVSSKDAMGKPTAADLKLGLATAPVLFACEKVRYTRGRGYSREP